MNSTKTAVLMMGIVLAVLVSYVIALGIPGYENSEEKYQRTTSAEVKTQHVAMAEQLKTVTPGDFLIYDGYTYAVIVPPYGIEDGRINYKRVRPAGWNTGSTDDLGRRVNRLVRKTDPNWAEVAKQFFAQ